MNDFTLKSWQAALSKVYAKAALDPAYRELCLSDPREAVRKVSRIRLPRDFRFEFIDHPRKIVSSLLLPPLLAPVPPDRRKEIEKDVRELTAWCVGGYAGPVMMMHTIGGGGTHDGSGSPGIGSGSGSGHGGER